MRNHVHLATILVLLLVLSLAIYYGKELIIAHLGESSSSLGREVGFFKTLTEGGLALLEIGALIIMVGIMVKFYKKTVGA